MSYVITGLSPEPFRPLFGLADADLAARGVIRKTVNARPGYPCRITLDDPAVGESVLLLNHASHDVATPYRSTYAIYVTEGAEQQAHYTDALPPVMRERPIALRLFDVDGMLVGADLGMGADVLSDKITAALAREDVAYIHAHNAMHGCFAAEVRRA